MQLRPLLTLAPKIPSRILYSLLVVCHGHVQLPFHYTLPASITSFRYIRPSYFVEEISVILSSLSTLQLLQLRILEMPLMQPYIKQGLGVQLEEDPVDLEDLKDLEEEEEVRLHQSQLHTWFQLQQTLMCVLWAHCPESLMKTGNKQTCL